MQSQLRIYSIKEGLLNEFVEFWRSEIVPLRRSFGFVVAGAWADAERRTFAWVVMHADFEAAAAAYYDSPDRKALSRDPGDFIESSDLRMMESISAG